MSDVADRDVKLYDLISAALFAKDTILNGAVQRVHDAIVVNPDVVLRALGGEWRESQINSKDGVVTEAWVAFLPEGTNERVEDIDTAPIVGQQAEYMDESD